MSVTHDVGDIAAFAVASQNLLAYFEDVTYTIDETQVDGSVVSRDGMSPTGTKLAGKIATTLLSTYASPDRVSHLNLQALALGATTYLGVVKSVDFSGSFTAKMRAGVGAWFKRPQNVKKDYSISLELDCDDGVAASIMVAMHSTVPTDRDVIFGMTLNGVPITVTGRLQQAEHAGKRDDLQTLKLTIKGKDTGSGAYPTTPTGTTSILEQAFNAWKSPVGFTYTSHATAGFSVTGQMIFSSFSFKLEDEALVKNQYSFDSFGTVAASSTAS